MSLSMKKLPLYKTTIYIEIKVKYLYFEIKVKLIIPIKLHLTYTQMQVVSYGSTRQKQIEFE